jgi:hypothetical protein
LALTPLNNNGSTTNITGGGGGGGYGGGTPHSPAGRVQRIPEEQVTVTVAPVHCPPAPPPPPHA